MKTKELKIKEEFGEFCAEGRVALDLLNARIIPMLDAEEKVVFDFDGVRNINASFANALFANLSEKYGNGIIDRLVFKNTRENVKKEIIGSLSFGLKNAS